MRGRLDPNNEASILASLDIGPRKAVGYLPLDTIRDVLERDPSELAEELRARGFSVRIFSAKECSIKSGALYAWDEAGVKRIFKEHSAHEIEVDEIVLRIARTWFEPHHGLMPLIRDLFGRTPSAVSNSILPENDPKILAEWRRLSKFLHETIEADSKAHGWDFYDCFILAPDPKEADFETGNPYVGVEFLAVQIHALNRSIAPRLKPLCILAVEKFPEWRVDILIENEIEATVGTQWYPRSI